jgi:NADH dehydrogenase FAD-containing subunit
MCSAISQCSWARTANRSRGLAQVAKQEGQYLGRALVTSLRTGAASPPFRFHNRGNTAIIGRNVAVFDFGWWRLRGWLPGSFWALIHVYLLVGFEHRLLVAIQMAVAIRVLRERCASHRGEPGKPA